MKKGIFSLNQRPKAFRSALNLVAVFSAALLCFLFLINDLNVSDSSMSFTDRFSVLSEGWHRGEDVSGESITLPIHEDLDQGETGSYSITIPKMPSPSTVLVIRNYHQELRIFIDDEMIYEFPSAEENLTDTIITDTWNRIYLSEDDEGHILTIKLTAGIGGFSGFLEPMYFGEDNSIMAHLQSKYLFPFALGVLCLILGLLLIVVATIYSSNNTDGSHLILGFVFISLGIWFVDRSMMPILMVGSNMKFFASFSLLTLAPLLMALYVAERFSFHDQTIPNLIILFNVGVIFAMFSLVGAKVIPLHGAIPLVYLAILVTCLYMAYLAGYYSYGKGKLRLNQVQLYSVKLEFLSIIFASIGSIASLTWDTIQSQANGTAQGQWSAVGNIQMVSVLVFAAFHFIILVYNSYYSALESEATQKKLHDSQLQLMMGQIQPHFMFNTLSSIRTLIKVDPSVAYDMIYNFSNYLRANVDNLTNMEGITFAEEVKHIQNYVNIEKVRFGDRLSMEFDINDTEFIVPPLSIQPLVENAIKHGVCKRIEGGTVCLRSFQDEHNFIVEVVDNGVGIPQEKLEVLLAGAKGNDSVLLSDSNFTGNGSEQHQSTGMRNITLRLKEFSNATLDIKSEEGKGTLMRVTFPKDGQPKPSAAQLAKPTSSDIRGMEPAQAVENTSPENSPS